jgi:hypothetical protein
MALTKITKSGLTGDVVDETKIADNAISEEHLDTTAVTGFDDLGSNIATSDQIVVYDQSSGTLKKISQTNFLNFPVVSSVSPTNALSGDGTGNYTFTITGTGFTGASADLLNSSGTAVAFDSVTVDSSTQITGVIAKSSLPGSGEPYDVRVTAGSGLRSILENQINVDQTPVFTTASGLLGNQVINTAGSFSVNATDPESAGNVTFELQSGSLPPGYSITNTAAEGGTAIISGTDSTTSSTTTFNFVLRAVDAASNTSSRSFSIQSRTLISESFTSSGTFSIPSGITSIDVLVVGGGAGGGSQHGGGGGAGGLIFMPAYSVTPSGTITVTVGSGGCGGQSGSPPNPNGGGLAGQDSAFGSPGDPGLGQDGVLTAKGGGGGKGSAGAPAIHGGSGGGGQRQDTTGGAGTQPTQPGNSGSYGFGNPGGNALGAADGGAGGGGAGAAGANVTGAPGGDGGAGKAYTIADGTTPVYYAGGGGGGGHVPTPAPGGTGGQGGGGAGGSYCTSTAGGLMTAAGQANKGGGGGGSGASPNPGESGGSGVVIVRY